jgi:hypothetical protein
MLSRQSAAWLVFIAVLALWIYSFGIRHSYMDQVPVFDSDAMTSESHMWARMWWDQGPFKMWFSTPVAPPSIEAPLVTQEHYESWPPGAFVPIYLIAKFLGIPPSIPMVNWINAVMHGLIVLAVAFTAFKIACLNRLDNLSSSLLAIAASIPIMLSAGPIYVFSQVYDNVTASLIYTAVFLLLEAAYYCVQSQGERRIIGVLQLVTIFCAFLVDWLPYTLFAFWLVSRSTAGYLGFAERMTLRRFAGLALLPIAAFASYLYWRLFAPGSMAASSSIRASLDHLLYKIEERMNLAQDNHVTGFFGEFIGDMHSNYYAEYTFPLIVLSVLIVLALLIIAFRRAQDYSERRAIFAAGSILMLAVVPFYVHMLILYEHTYIHRWALTKAMFAYALVPFALLPISVFIILRQFAGRPANSWRRIAIACAGFVLAASALFGAVDMTGPARSLLGRVDLASYNMYTDIGRNTLYKDVVVSPVLEADPMSREIGVTYKLIHHADNFSDVDKLVEHVCGDFNVVVALPKGASPGEFASREPSEIIDLGSVRLLKYASYQRKATACS